MYIKHRISFHKNELSLIQEIDSGLTSAQVKPGVEALQNSLRGSFVESEAAARNAATGQLQAGGGNSSPNSGGGNSSPDSGGIGVTGGSPITIFGPFIFMCPDQDDFAELVEVDNDE